MKRLEIPKKKTYLLLRRGTSTPPKENAVVPPEGNADTPLRKEIDIPLQKTIDILIAVMGPTGSGKSTIIDNLVDHGRSRASSKMAPCTQEISTVRLPNHPTYGDRIVLIDTPGFDNTDRSDAEVLEMVRGWLKQTYQANVKIAGIIYLHRIQKTRMTAAPHRNLHMFGKLCGENAASKVLLTTTTWDITPAAVAEAREAELIETLWKPMLADGATFGRFLNTKTSAWDLVEKLLVGDSDFVTAL